MIGRVIEHLGREGLLDNTLILFTADHGDLLGDFGSFFKRNHMNGSVRIPFLAAGPGVKPGQVSDALVGLQDILPTFAAAAGTGIGQPVHGCNLMPALRGETGTVRDLFYSQTRESPWQSSMITDGAWKYVDSEGNATEELYDQVNDAGETRNMAADSAQRHRLDGMRAQLVEAARTLRDEAIFEGEGLQASPLNRESFRVQQYQSMGWRWY